MKYLPLISIIFLFALNLSFIFLIDVRWKSALEKSSGVLVYLEELRHDISEAHLWLEESFAGDASPAAKEAVTINFEKLVMNNSIMIQELALGDVYEQRMKEGLESIHPMLVRLNELAVDRFNAKFINIEHDIIDAEFDGIYHQLHYRFNTLEEDADALVEAEKAEIEMALRIIVVLFLFINFLIFFLLFRLKQKNEKHTALIDNQNIELKSRLYRDNLTKLGNRYALEERLIGTEEATILLIDINNFKFYNEIYSPEAGNTILMEVADALREFSGDWNFEPYRISGDEFVLLCGDLEPTHGGEKVLGSLFEKFRNMRVELPQFDEMVSLDITLGISTGEGYSLAKADMALNSAKEHNTKYLVYDSSMDKTEEHTTILHWKEELKTALAKGNIVPYFQPIVDREGTIVKYEALMRLIREEEGVSKVVTPYHFLQASFKTKQYHELSNMMLEKTFASMQKINVPFSINVSFHDIRKSGYEQHLKGLLSHYSLHQEKLFRRVNTVYLEIVESEAISDMQILYDFIESIREYNVKIVIDDFGSGYSNFSHILHIKPPYLKIDGSLIKEIDTDKNALVLVRAILEFAKELNIKTIAEFVHNESVFKVAKELGVDEFQGYYFGEPDSYLR
jgi:diguanylate cyclase (GGDEF)-like protein